MQRQLDVLHQSIEELNTRNENPGAENRDEIIELQNQMAELRLRMDETNGTMGAIGTRP
jgi:hypothetical protein